ncbi:unnamed protein product [Prunus armeniaca]|uniref:DNA/RNA-binding protein Alba-like domain-containing protein n=1 Tax=Prunus armeniaca TaxID=36596 RepID=A0A6J5UKL3_PRUAR|nr:unnamed protein product [Prunus armeniaca]
MKGVTKGVNNLQVTDSSYNKKKNRIQNNEVELFALGMAIATVVTTVEIMKNNGLTFEKKIRTSTIDMRED